MSTTYTSETYCNEENPSYEGLFSHDRGTTQLTISDSFITDEVVGEARARSELLQGGYAERWISIRCIHISGLKQNDIISFNGVNWIVKELSYSFSSPELYVTIKGLRYE